MVSQDPNGKEGQIAYFQIGTGQTAARYACQKAAPLEEQFLCQINAIMEVATKACLGPDHQFIPFNALGINVYDCSSKAGYSFHTDGNIMH